MGPAPLRARRAAARCTKTLFSVLDVKSSWRKAVEEDRAQKLGRPGSALDGAAPGQQEAPPRTPAPLWDTWSIIASGAGGDVQFSLEQETLPELPSLDEDDGSFLDRQGTPDQEDLDLAGTTEKVFSLDLDSLETPSSPKTQEFVLPNLITFSPIDDRKC